MSSFLRVRCGENVSSASSDDSKEFKWDEIERAVRSMPSGRAPGMDGVTAEIVKRV